MKKQNAAILSNGKPLPCSSFSKESSVQPTNNSDEFVLEKRCSLREVVMYQRAKSRRKPENIVVNKCLAEIQFSFSLDIRWEI